MHALTLSRVYSMLIYMIYISAIYGIYIIMVEIYGSTEHYKNI